MGIPGAHSISAGTYTQVAAGVHTVVRWWPAGADRHTILLKSNGTARKSRHSYTQVAASYHTVQLKRDGTAVACGNELVAAGKARKGRAGMTAKEISFNAAFSAREKGSLPVRPPPTPPSPLPYWIHRLVTLVDIPMPNHSSHSCLPYRCSGLSLFPSFSCLSPSLPTSNSAPRTPTLDDVCKQVTSRHVHVTHVLKERLRAPPYVMTHPTPTRPPSSPPPPPPPFPPPPFPSSSYASTLSPPPGLHLPTPLSCSLPPTLFSTSSPNDLPVSSQYMFYPTPDTSFCPPVPLTLPSSPPALSSSSPVVIDAQYAPQAQYHHHDNNDEQHNDNSDNSNDNNNCNEVSDDDEYDDHNVDEAHEDMLDFVVGMIEDDEEMCVDEYIAMSIEDGSTCNDLYQFLTSPIFHQHCYIDNYSIKLRQ